MAFAMMGLCDAKYNPAYATERKISPLTVSAKIAIKRYNINMLRVWCELHNAEKIYPTPTPPR
jgi:hypothetical protein